MLFICTFGHKIIEIDVFSVHSVMRIVCIDLPESSKIGGFRNISTRLLRWASSFGIVISSALGLVLKSEFRVVSGKEGVAPERGGGLGPRCFLMRGGGSALPGKHLEWRVRGNTKPTSVPWLFLAVANFSDGSKVTARDLSGAEE